MELGRRKQNKPWSQDENNHRTREELDGKEEGKRMSLETERRSGVGRDSGRDRRIVSLFFRKRRSFLVSVCFRLPLNPHPFKWGVEIKVQQIYILTV